MYLFPRAILLFVTGVFISAAPAATLTAKDLALEEGRFAAHSVEHGMRAAFLEYFAAKSWLLRPAPVDAQAWISGRPDPAIILDWRSVRTLMSASGELGFSTGPSIIRSKTEPGTAAQHGQFFSVWQKQASDAWKVLVDHGISHAGTTPPDALPSTPLQARDLPPAAASTARDDIESRFAGASNAPYADFITDNTRLLRGGELPIDGVAAIQTYLASRQGQWTWTPTLQGTSLANDFAYAAGVVQWQPVAGAARSGSYVRVWVREAMAGTPARWTLLSDVVTFTPLPK